MNIQIFGTSKNFDVKKAQRYFSERRIKVQYIDISEKPLSRGEWNSVRAAVGIEALIDERGRDSELIALLRYLTDDAREEKIFENQHLLRLPIVRNGKAATVGYAPKIWKTWE